MNLLESPDLSVFTKDVSRAIRVAKGLEAGTVGVNSTAMWAPDFAFGGWKGSGVGRELGHHGKYIAQ